MCACGHVRMDRGSREFTAFRTRGRRLPCAGTHAAAPMAAPSDPERRGVSWRHGEARRFGRPEVRIATRFRGDIRTSAYIQRYSQL